MRKRSSREPKTREKHFPVGNRKRTWQRWRIAIGIVLAALLISAAFIFWPRPKQVTVDPARLAEDPSLGPPTAAVTIVEYGDFGCTTCRAWFKAGIMDKIRAQYGDRVRFVWRDFPIITAQSPKAAEAGQCAFDQGRFWEYHDLLYERAPALSVSDLKSYASQLGLDTATFNHCLDSGQYKDKVDRSLQDAYAHHFVGTPSFLVNGQPLAGPPSLETLQGLINSILASG